MIASIIPEIAVDFNFDIVLLVLFGAYIVYGYLSGGHKQIRLSINLILPFVIIYYMGNAITSYMYVPLSNTFFFEILSEFVGFAKNIVTMMFAYIVTYFLLFFGIFLLSIYAKKYLLNENMRAKLGKKNNYLGVLFSLLNGYVLVYFIILPAFSMNLVGANARLTNFVMEHPPPFSRIARTAEKAVPVKHLTDKADAFQELLSVEGIESYYNDAIYSYQQEYIGGANSKEEQFMEVVYPELTEDAKTMLDNAYFDEFGSSLGRTNYYGVSYILVQETTSDQLLYQELLTEEERFVDVYQDNLALVQDYQQSVLQYELDLANYEYQVAYNAYVDELDDYLDQLDVYMTNKVNAMLAGTAFTDSFTLERPELAVAKPAGYKELDPLVLPTNPEESQSQAILDAFEYVETYQDKIDVRTDLTVLGTDFRNHKGLLTWYIEELSQGQNLDPGQADISTVIVSFKNNYESIIEEVNDNELEEKLYLAQMSIRSYDVFTLWLDCTMENMAEVPLEEIPLPSNRCTSIDPSDVDAYDFTDSALSIVSTLFEGESVSWIITQFKYDYEAGLFDTYFEDFVEVQDVLSSTKELVDEYDEYYKDIATSIEGDISMLLKIGISVMKYNLDVYDTLENTPLLAAMFNDAARFCGSPDRVIGYDVEICEGSGDNSGFLGDFLNMRYLVSEVYLKAYFMVDENNERRTYDSEEMLMFLETVNQSIEDNVITTEVVTAIADQFAFHVIDETTGKTLLDQMYEEGYITIEAMRIMADDEYGMFSDDFRARVRSLIR